MGDLTAAHDMYTALLDLNPYDADTLYNYAVLLFEEEDIVRAKDIISRAIDIQPKDTAILFFHGKLSYVTDEYEKAAGSLEQYTDSEPDDAQALEMLADSYAELRYFGKALEYYDRAIEVKSAAPEILFKKAKLLLVEAGEFEDGMQTLEKALKAGFADEEALQSLLENDILFGEERIKLLLQKQGLLPLFEHQDASNAQQEEDKAAAEDEEKQPSDEEKQEGETSETLP
jgi:tetratricopeptide (TPR) repeat protein